MFKVQKIEAVFYELDKAESCKDLIIKHSTDAFFHDKNLNFFMFQKLVEFGLKYNILEQFKN